MTTIYPDILSEGLDKFFKDLGDSYLMEQDFMVGEGVDISSSFMVLQLERIYCQNNCRLSEPRKGLIETLNTLII